MISLKLELCLVLTLYLIAFHRVASQCQEFDVQPMDTIVPLSSMTCLTCDYPDSTAEEWFRDGTSILPGSEEDSCNCEVFANEGRICFNSVSVDDVGEYDCQVLIGFGQICSSAAQLTLAVPPVIDEITEPVTVVAGEMATIPVSVTGLPAPMVQFIRDGEVLTNDSRITVEDRQLIISNVDMEDRGSYSIRANNSAGIDTHTRTLLVEFVPSLTVDQSAEVNGMVTLTCTAVSYPMPVVNRWERDGEVGMPLVGEEVFTTTDIDFTVTITVTVPCVPEGYFCVVENSQGMIRSGITICGVDIPSPPDISVELESATSVIVTWNGVTDPIATSYTLQYREAGSSAYMNRTVEENTNRVHMESIRGLRSGVTYEFRAASVNTAGMGEFGEIMPFAVPAVTVVTGVMVTETVMNDRRAISIIWDAFPDPGTGYKIDYSISGVPQAPISVEPDTTRYLLLVPADCNNIRVYTFSVQAEGPETASNTVELEVNCVIPPFPTQAVTIDSVEAFGTAITVGWKVDDSVTEEGRMITGLVITVRELNSNGDVKITNNYTVPPRDFVQRSKCVGKLMVKTTYEICIVANISGRPGEEINCYDSMVLTQEVDLNDVTGCAQPTTVEIGSRLEDSGDSGGIADWVIAVIVVGVLAIVALAFCLMGVFFACHNSQRKVDFGSHSSLHTESLSSAVHIQNHRPMSPSRSCLSYHSKGHSTNWNDHVDTLRALDSGVATAV